MPHWTCHVCGQRWPTTEDDATESWRSHYASAHPDGAGKKPTNGEGVT